MGQVLIEVALATVGVVVIAFVMARAANWLNRSMVQRNQSFQSTRMAAAQSAGLVRVAAPSQINLIGPGAARGGGAGSQPASSYNRSCPAGTSFYNQATMHRQAADACMREGELERQQAMDLSATAKELVIVSNKLEVYRRKIEQCNTELWFEGVALGTCQTTLAQCQSAQASCLTSCADCQTNCNQNLFLCVVGCGPPSMAQAICAAACHITHNACMSGPAGCDEQFCQTSPCTTPLACGDCNAEQAARDAKQVECDGIVASRDTYCWNKASQYGVALDCAVPATAMGAANGKMGQVNSHIAQARNRARCVHNEIPQAEDAERQAVRACARR